MLRHHKAVYAEDLPKMDFVAPSVKKQILEGNNVNLTILLSSKYDLPQQHNAIWRFDCRAKHKERR